jgi:5-methylcytosine-specific restriction endonuclease McrA
MPASRRCNKCGIGYPLTAEYWQKNVSSPTGLRSICRGCHNSAQRGSYIPGERKAYRETNRERDNAGARDRYARNPDRLRKLALKSSPEWRDAQQKAKRERTKIQRREWWTKNSERLRSLYSPAQRSAYHRSNREKENAQNREWYARHREARNEQIKKYQAAKPEAKKARAIKYYKVNRARLYAAHRARLAANPDRARAYWQKRYALEKNAVGSFTAEDLREIYEEQRGLCFYCNTDLSEQFEVDHYVPLSKGGSNDRRNLRLACRSCNRSKGNKLPERFYPIA